jgi:hypothetical protein
VVLMTGWAVGAAGLILALTAAGDHGSGRDERAGTGIALVMAGLLVVLVGNYIHHAAVARDGQKAGQAAGDDEQAPTDG